MNYKRVFLVLLDSVGIGEAPDAADFGDAGANTIRTIYNNPNFNVNLMPKLGLFNIDDIGFGVPYDNPIGAYGKAKEVSKGKDTTTGHWEIMGKISDRPFPTYPNGFPPEIIEEFERQTGRKVIVNKPYSGTEVIKDYGEEHLKTGALIVYTSADSVFQIAAHEEVVPLEELYRYCKIAREILKGEHAVGRVIARPFVGTNRDDFTRTPNRHDFSLIPEDTALNRLKNAGKDVIAIGKINDIYANSGITEFTYTHGNTEGMEITESMLEKDFTGLCFTNLVDFDMLYGHRNNIDGYAKAYSEFDSWLGNFIEKLNDDDLVMVTADHGCDPGYPTTDHTREYIPIIVYGKNINPVNLGIRSTFADIGKTITDIFGVETDLPGTSFYNDIRK